jgi:hypothetical protein
LFGEANPGALGRGERLLGDVLRWQPEMLTPASVRGESYRLRAAAWHAFFRLKLLCDDAELMRLAGVALELAAALPRAVSKKELTAQGEQARDALDAFVDAAAARLRDPA